MFDAATLGIKFPPCHTTLPDKFIDHDKPENMYKAAGLDAASIETKVIDTLNSKIVLKKTNSTSLLQYCDLPKNEALRRIPAIKLAKNNLKWTPIVGINKGLDLTIDFFKEEIKK